MKVGDLQERGDNRFEVVAYLTPGVALVKENRCQHNESQPKPGRGDDAPKPPQPEYDRRVQEREPITTALLQSGHQIPGDDKARNGEKKIDAGPATEEGKKVFQGRGLPAKKIEL